MANTLRARSLHPSLEHERGSALALIRAHAATLGRRENAVARVVLERPYEVPQWSTQRLAAEAGTSTATVIRACQSLGFRGFQHLRLELAREAPGAVASEGFTAATGSAETPGHADDTVTRAFGSARAALLVAGNAIDRATLATAAAMLAGARRVVCTANGFSGPPLQDAAMRLATIGRPVEAPVDILAQQFAAHSLGPEDVCFALSHSGANAHTLATVRAARARGAQVVAICSYAGAPIPDLAACTITAGAAGPQHAVDPFFARITHSVLLHALIAEVAACLTPEGMPGIDPGIDPGDALGEALGMRDIVADALSDELD